MPSSRNWAPIRPTRAARPPRNSKLGAAAVPFLREAGGESDPEIAARSKELLWELTPLTRRWSAIPETAAWRSQKLEGADLEIARRLDQMRFDLTFENAKFDDILAFVRDFSSFKIEVKAPPPAHEITFKVKDLLLSQCLDLLVLPLGLDLRIEGGAIHMDSRGSNPAAQPLPLPLEFLKARKRFPYDLDPVWGESP